MLFILLFSSFVLISDLKFELVDVDITGKEITNIELGLQC